MRLLLACGILLLAAQAAEARAPSGIIECDMRGCGPQPSWTQPQQRTYHKRQAKHDRPKPHKVAAAIVSHTRIETRSVGSMERQDGRIGLVDHPSGCPRTAFCGCGAAVKVFGKPVRELWLAANWFKFKAAQAAAGMVAVRRHHVFVILEVVGHNKVLAWDANSGGHKTRIHLRSLAGYRVVDPKSG